MEARSPFQPTPFGQYLLLERIGSGGMAEIFRAKTFGAAGFEKEYAIKRILPNLGADEEFVEMFVNEAKLVVDLYHANIVQVFDLGAIDNAYFIAMEFVHGKDLLDLLARCTENDLKIPLKLTMYCLMEMLKGLDFAHKAKNRVGDPLGIIHRDVSPSNIMLSYTGNVKVGDFGVAKAKTQTHLTEVGTLKGKVGYMSPEQVRGEDIDHRSDVFAAGIILYEALTMPRLFMGGNDLDVMLKIRDSDIEDDLARCTKVPPGLVDVTRKSLAKKRDERFQSCAELHGALQNFAYKHDIKATSTDLARFMRTVFAEEISAEKAKRLEDSINPVPSVDRFSQMGRPPTHAGPQPSVQLEAPPPIAGYRYKSPDGTEQGPMPLHELKALLGGTAENAGELVALGDGPWRLIDDLPELWSVERSEVAFGPTKTVEEQSLSASDLGHAATQAVAPSPSIDAEFTHTGRLGRVSFARLLYRLQRRRCTGMLRLVHGENVKQIFFRRGDPISATSTNTDERLGTYLVRRKIITEEQLGRGLSRLAEFGGRLGDALVGERVLPTHDLFQYLTEQLQDRLKDLFIWPTADWAWFPGVAPTYPPTSLGLHVVDLIVSTVRNTMTPINILQHFSGREGLPMEVVHSRLAIEDLPLLLEELRVAEAVGPGMAPMELLASLKAPGTPQEQIVWRVIYYLTEFELYRLGTAAEEPSLPG